MVRLAVAAGATSHMFCLSTDRVAEIIRPAGNSANRYNVPTGAPPPRGPPQPPVARGQPAPTGDVAMEDAVGATALHQQLPAEQTSQHVCQSTQAKTSALGLCTNVDRHRPTAGSCKQTDALLPWLVADHKRSSEDHHGMRTSL
jgi:hypothetical protein